MALPEVTNCYEITEKFSYYGQVMINRYHYLASAGTAPNYANLVADFIIEVCDRRQLIMTAACAYTEITVMPLFGSNLGYSQAHTDVGAIAVGDEMPPFIAAQYRLLHGDRRVRPGQKRFSGLSEAMMDGLGLHSTFASANAALCTGLVHVLTDATLDFTPVVIHYPSVKYPSIITASLTSAVFVGWTSQNSRKIGRGR